MKTVEKKLSLSVAEVKKQLGIRIKALRLERGLTQEDLADAMNKHTSYVGAIETGKIFPRVGNFIKIAQSLGVSLSQLFLFEGDIPPKQRSIQEIVDYLKERPERDARFILSMCKEQVKQYSSTKRHKQ